jgi:hypothetical protein
MAMARTMIEDTYVRVVYSRPYKRGRENIFGAADSGALVPYGERWRTGANEATEITLTGDLEVGGRSLAAGNYSLTTTPSAESWTVHFNSALGLNGNARQNPETGAFEVVDLAPSRCATSPDEPSTSAPLGARGPPRSVLGQRGRSGSACLRGSATGGRRSRRFH